MGGQIQTFNLYNAIQDHIAAYIEAEIKIPSWMKFTFESFLYFPQDFKSHYNENQNKLTKRYLFNNQILVLKEITHIIFKYYTYLICTEFF